MVLLTAPCFDSGEQPNGMPWPEDDPARLERYNQLLREVAAEHPATVRVEDFDSMVCPGGVYSTTRDGVQIRDGDGVHIVPTPAAGQWLADHLLPGSGPGRTSPDGRPQPASHPARRPPVRLSPRSRRPACRRVRRPAGPEPLTAGERSRGPVQPPGVDEDGGGWLNTELSALWHWARNDGTSTDSGTRLISDSVVTNASHWMSW